MKKISNLVAATAFAAIAALAITLHIRRNYNNNPIETRNAQIHHIRSMAQLCSMEIYTEIPVKDTIDNKMIFAIQKQQGKISFDIDTLDISFTGDTILITLPPEIIEINESTDKNAWQVIDTKGLSLFTSDKLSLDQENIIKQRIHNKAIQRLYTNGTVAHARAQARENLNRILQKIYQQPVIFTDPTPQGITSH